MLRQRILRNLPADATRYTRQGGILLACRLHGAGRASAAEAAGPHWRIEVWNIGLGIAEAEQGRNFEGFGRSTSRAVSAPRA